MNKRKNNIHISYLLIVLLYLASALPIFTAPPPSPDLHATGAAAISSLLSAAVRQGDVPGVVVLITAPDRVLYHQAFGKMDVARDLDMRKDSIFRIASMTKALTSTAVMMLIEEGKLSLDDEVRRYLPAFQNPQAIKSVDLTAGTYQTRPATRAITIRQLLTHTSGIGYTWSDPGLALVEKLTGRTSETDLPLIHEPGEKWTYGAGTKVLGDVVEKIAGLSLDTFLGNRIFRPLGMVDTAWNVPDDKHARVVTLHQRKEGRLIETPNPTQISSQVRGDGRLFSTATDYGRFLQMILHRGRLGTLQLLKPETVDEMSRNQTGKIKVRLQPIVKTDMSKPFPLGAGEDVWGLGFQLATPAKADPDMRRPGSMSWAGINNTFFWIDPKERIGAVVLMQFQPFYDEAAIRLLRNVEAQVYKHLQPTR